jgi:hypothetical protein
MPVTMLYLVAEVLVRDRRVIRAGDPLEHGTAAAVVQAATAAANSTCEP